MNKLISPFQPARRVRPASLLLAAGVAAVLSACGGVDQAPASTRVAAAMATGTTTIALTPPTLPDEAASQMALPAFNIAPALLDAPADADVASLQDRHRMTVSAEFSRLSSRRLTVQGLEAAHRARASGRALAEDTTAAPMASGGVISTYTPAQIRAAYGQPALPATGATPTAAQAAAMGAGQTIYIVDAQHDPNVAAELAAFNTKFGLPACTTKAIAAGSALALPAASATACELSVVYSTAGGALTATQPGYDAGWATEIALDVQWAHATAPLARIVLIEAATPSLSDLTGAVKVANVMGPGVVSMSFGAAEGSWTSSTDAVFNNPKMSYLAATGDNGAGVSWPAVSPYVVAVGGTTLSYTGSGVRSEVSWSGTGGGTSQYTATPSYQNSTVPGMGTPAHRTVADVAFNADPQSGQYLAVIASGSSTVSWLSAGGTSLATPQWAGLLAVANAQRAQAAKAVLGAPHAMFYTQIGAVPGTYASVFADVTKGSDGSCATCTSKTGYDPLAGLGTPNVASLLGALAGMDAKTAPVVTPATINGSVGTALSFTVAVLAPNPVTYTLTNAPASMAISGAGAVTWATPLAGSYAVTVTAKDSKTGLSGQGLYNVVISAPAPPVVVAATISAKVGVALSFSVVTSGANPLALSLTGAPSGMSISTAGVVSWPAPVAGTFAVTVVAKDSKTGLSGQGVSTVVVTAQGAPVVSAATVNGRAGTPLNFNVSATSTNALSYSLTGAPAGMAISASGAVSWASPVAGSYAVTAVAKDSKTGLSGQAVITVKISSTGPALTAAPMTGVAGTAFSGIVGISDPGATSMSMTISGLPMGMAPSASGSNIALNWASPVAGSYALKVSVVDNAGLTANATVAITISAK